MSVFFLTFAFQNCSQPPQATQKNESVTNSFNLEISNSLANKINLNEESIENVLLYFEEIKKIEKSGNLFSIKFNKLLTLNLGSNQIIESNDLDSNTQIFCLTDELKSELLSLLNASQICKSQPVLEEGQACAKNIISPYAEVITNAHVYELGYASDSCGHDAVDLCGDQPQLLAGYITNLKNIYTQLSCN